MMTKIKLLIKKYLYFFSVNLSSYLVGLYYSIKINIGSINPIQDVLNSLSTVVVVIFLVSAITILPLDLY